MRKKIQVASMLLMSMVALGAKAEIPTFSWERTWLDEVQMRWQPPVANPDGMQAIGMDDWEPAFSFDVAANCTVSDGKYVYSGATSFNMYDMDGNFIDNFSIPGLPEMYCMTYDGTYFYGTSYEQFGIFQIDMQKRELVRIIPTQNQMYHIAYIPTLDGGKGGFEVGNPVQGTFLRKDGTPLGGLLNYAADMGSGWFCYGTVFVNGKLYIYCSDQTSIRKVMEYDVEKQEYTGKSFDLNEFVGIGGVEDGFAARNITTYTYPENKQYLMLVDFNGLKYRTASVPVGVNPLVEGLEGYEVYRDGKKVSSEPLDAEAYVFTDSGLSESTPYKYEVRAVSGEMDGKALFEAVVELPSTSVLPMVEDFSSYEMTMNQPDAKMTANYWTITPEMPTQKWTVTNASNKCIQFSYAPDTKYGQTLVSKPLEASAGHQVKMSMAYACNYYGQGAENERMTVQVTTDGGENWTEAGSIFYKASTAFKTVEFDLTDLVAGKRFQIRLKGAGESVSINYNWQIDDVKIWGYESVSASGTVTFAGTNVSEPLNLSLVMDGVGTAYSFATDENGRFEMEGVESGVYDITVSAGRFSQTVEDYEISSEKSEYSIDLPGGYFEGETSGLELTVAPGASQTVAYPFGNAGNADAFAAVSLGFDGLGEDELLGNSDLDVVPEWTVETAFDLATAGETGLFFHEGRIWTKTNDYSATKLNGYTPDGVLAETVELTVDGELPNTLSGFFEADGTVYVYTMAALWKDPVVPVYIIPVDWASKTVKTSEKIAIDQQISSVSAAIYDKKAGMLYLKDQSNALYQVAKDGAVVKKITLPGIYYSGLAMDTFSADGPYLWMVEKINSPIGFDIVQYSLSDEQFTIVKHSVNDDPESILSGAAGRVVADASLIGSMQVVAGYYSLVVRQNISGVPAAGGQIMVYRLFPVESWLRAEGGKNVSGGGLAELSVTVDASGMADGETKQGTVTVSSKNLGADLTVPVTLRADASMSELYPAPENLTAKVNGNYEVELAWTQPETEFKVKSYRVIRDNEELEGSTASTGYTDYLPKEGKQTYKVAAVYESGYRTVSAEAAEAEVKDPVWGMPVSNMKAEVVARDNVNLSWDRTPKYRNAFFDDFESYEPFAIDGIGGWTLVDGDGMWTYANNNLDYPHEGERMGGMIYNPTETSPADSEIGNGSEQSFAFFSGNISQLANDDWLISPELSLKGKSTFRFEACTRVSSYGKERIYAAYSTTGNAPEDFIPLTDKVIEVEQVWTAFEFDVPADTRYVAIHYVSMNSFVLLVDNVFVGQASGYSPVSGFNVYRDGTKQNEELLADNRYTDYNLPDGEYSYEVEIVFENGASAKTDPQTLTISTASKANPPRELELTELAEGNVRLTWKVPEMADAEQLRYDNGEVANSLGGDEEFYVAVKWDEADLKLYEGYSITGIHFHVAEPVVSVTPLLFRDGEVVRAGDEIEPEAGVFNDYAFSEPLLIESGHSYMAGYFAVVDPGAYPLSHDAGPGTPGKSDLISADGVEWNSVFQMYGTAEYDFNWNIAADLEVVPMAETSAEKTAALRLPKRSGSKGLKMEHKYAEANPGAYVSEAADRFMGYNVYRNDVCLNENPLAVLAYTDKPEADAVYHVTAIWLESGELASNEVSFSYGGLDAAVCAAVVYPNPVRDWLCVKGEFDRILIHSGAGQLVYEVSESGTETEISVAGFAKGAYIVSVIKGSGAARYKVVVE